MNMYMYESDCKNTAQFSPNPSVGLMSFPFLKLPEWPQIFFYLFIKNVRSILVIILHPIIFS